MQTPEDPKEYNPYKWGIFYYDPEDKRVLIPKRFGIGWTFNFGNWKSYVLVAVLISLVAWMW